ncbi:MAG TPA: hypothetical protein VLX32_05675 [Candidatus Acidoferrum sp.]|nr:hypothetical protein [Candidatus Acidoferrum sp.]
MKSTFEEILKEVWRRTLVDGAREVDVGGKKFAVKKTARKRLRQVDFEFAGEEYRGLEQNPETKSRWAQMAREGKKVMQFLSGGRYVANVADGKVTMYGGRRS